MEQIATGLGFQLRAIMTPPTTFGAVEITQPPGALFQNGALRVDGEGFVPIRGLFIESRRIVVDVVTASDEADRVYGRLVEIVTAASPDTPAIAGGPTAQQDQSEVVADLEFGTDRLIPTELSDLMRTSYLRTGDTATPTLALHINQAAGEYTGIRPGDRVFTLSKRAGSTADSNTFYSAAPLSSTDHLEYLGRLEQAFRGADAT